MWKKSISIILLLCLSVCLWGQSSSVQSNLTKLEDYVTLLEDNSLTQQILIDDLRIRLQNAEQSSMDLDNQLTEALKQQDRQSNLLKNYERKYRNLKVAFIVTVPVTIIATSTVCLVLTNSK